MNILLADDHHLVREALSSYLRAHWEQCKISEAASVPDALQRLEQGESFDVIILDLAMPGMNGLHGLATMLKARPGTPVVILSGNIDPATAMAAVKAGARGIITKDLKGRAVVNAIEMVMAGEVFLPSSMIQRAVDDQATAAYSRDALRGALGGLTERELEVVKSMAAGMNNKEIAYKLTLSEGTVKLHISHIFKKLNARNRSDVVRIYFEVSARPR